MSPRDRSYLLDILEAGDLASGFLKGIDRTAFDQSPLLQSAVIRQLEVIGEATKRLSEEFRAKHPDVPWRNLAGMRDILIHAYNHVDIDQVWLAAKDSLPGIVDAIRALMSHPD